MTIKPVLSWGLAKKDLLAVLVLVVNTFSWYFPLYVFFETTLRKILLDPTISLAIFGIQYIVAIGFAIAGTLLVKKFASRALFLSIWLVIGTVVSALLVVIETSKLAYVWLIPFLLGISLGLGFPSCLAYFGDLSVGESRGRLGGIVWFASGICILLIGLLTSISSFVIGVLIFTAWRGIGFVLFRLIKPDRVHEEDVVHVSYKSILVDKSFLLYLIPWIMFCLVNFLERPITNNLFGNVAFLVPFAEYGIGAFAALIGGWFADSVGRKRITIFGFMVLGIGYAVLGLFPNIVFSWYLYIVLDGIAWGVFSLMFYLVIWSELAGNRTKEKYYLVGVLPFLISSYIQILFEPYVGLVPISTAFSLASFFLFLAVLPLLYAPETLPEKQIELRRLKRYMEKAKTIKEKHQAPSDKT
ncbi:MAG: MFS transporter [Candidatus Bathyarchaeota archaeon]|nr:MFS transporter [Candidatus Bathyarchaeota archaeon]MDH5732620.1 MFS transporter [Candidatus Bathyarchaeota archaeon]